MTPERWQRIEAIYNAAVERQPPEREAFLAEACRGDEDLRTEVESLLAQDASKTGTLDRPAWAGEYGLTAGGPTVTVIAPGTQLGPYKVEGLLGEGGMGKVYRGLDTRLGRAVAIKILSERFSARFEREARAISALNHPHICTLYDVGPNYLVLELVEGTPLKGPLATQKAIEYAGQILDALDAAHRKGIVHRDLKPGNILITKQGVKVLDFGLADIAGDPALTATGAVMGTPAYMAPEQWEGKPADARSDIYAFGCVLHEMLTGQRASRQGSADRTPVENAALESVIGACLEKDPDDRWQTARDIRRALALPSAPVAPFKRTWWPVAAAVTVAILAAGGWAVEHFRPAPPTTPVLRYQIVAPRNGQLLLGTNPRVGGMALSPDATTVAMVATVDGKTGLWLSPLDGSPPRLVEGINNPAYPFWSPDSRSVGFFADGMVQRFDLASGAVIEICPAPGLGVGGAWMDDGTILLGRIASGLARVPSSGGTPTLLTHLHVAEGERDHVSPQVLPGGRFMYLAQHERRDDNVVYAAKLDDPDQPVRVVNSGYSALYASGYLLFLRGETLIAQTFDPAALRLSGDPAPLAETFAGLIPIVNASVAANGILLYDFIGAKDQLIWTDRQGQKLRSLGEPGNYGPPRISFDGSTAVVQRFESGGSSDLWMMDIGRGLSQRLTSDPKQENYPIWSPDGRSVLFSDTRFLFRKPVPGIGGEELVATGTNLRIVTDWSRDGTTILYYESFPNTRIDVGTLEVTAAGKLKEGTQPRLYLSTPANEQWARFSPELNPRWTAYQSDESGKFEIYVDSFPQRRGAVRVSTAGGTYPQWGPISGNRSELFFVSGDSKLMAAELKLIEGRVEASPPRELFALAPAEAGAGSSPYDTAADGQHFLVRTLVDAVRPLTVIVNWPALLKNGAGKR
jgi:eukaryotic-like serine/threonine-protein kinase